MMKGILLSGLLCCLILKSSGQPVMNVLLGYQDSLGQYSFGYSTLHSARSEIKTVNGVIRGAYSYVDDNGVIQTTEYVADDDGFHVVSTNLPQSPLPVEDTAEVLAARKAHLEAFLIAVKMTEDTENKKVTNLSEKIVDRILQIDNEKIDDDKILRTHYDQEPQVSSSINNSRSIAIDQFPVPAFKISYGDQVLLPMGKDLSDLQDFINIRDNQSDLDHFVRIIEFRRGLISRIKAKKEL
uniref:Cuticle protein 6 n=1 Tax=Vespula pensylvanica TaxID=30213 RepID=A0A834KVU0_VESPE|nr:hypothetical protein H0235_012798 [Vespula pensylvanica]